MAAIITFLRFARAHTVAGTTLSLLALYLMAARHTGGSNGWIFAASLFACLCANVYITGLNQLTDIEIDRINKPYLPLASGAYSVRRGAFIVGLCLLLASLTALVYPPYLTLTVWSSIAIGTAYSLPPVRLKRFHFWAAFCIIVVRGLIVNLLLYLHFRTVLGGSASPSTSVWLLTAIIFTFGVVIAWFKDLPDTEGDAAYGIRTLSLVKDRRWVFRAGALVLCLTLIAAGLVAYHLGQTPLAAGQLIVLCVFAWLSGRVDLNDQASIARFYQGVWVLFFGEYILFGAFG